MSFTEISDRTHRDRIEESQRTEEKLTKPLSTIVALLALVFIVALTGYSLAWLLLIKAGNRLTRRQLALRAGMRVVDVGLAGSRFLWRGRLAQPVKCSGSTFRRASCGVPNNMHRLRASRMSVSS